MNCLPCNPKQFCNFTTAELFALIVEQFCLLSKGMLTGAFDKIRIVRPCWPCAVDRHDRVLCWHAQITFISSYDPWGCFQPCNKAVAVMPLWCKLRYASLAWSIDLVSPETSQLRIFCLAVMPLAFSTGSAPIQQCAPAVELIITDRTLAEPYCDGAHASVTFDSVSSVADDPDSVAIHRSGLVHKLCILPAFHEIHCTAPIKNGTQFPGCRIATDIPENIEQYCITQCRLIQYFPTAKVARFLMSGSISRNQQLPVTGFPHA